ncbi:MAG TPA: M56 family metallopeptidase [Vitreimonas sp.]|jgi:beta-lactamase regulating signal transducer with metallopeptidase domain|nr:M56 family metallopeptidase [Vitreimonas sp.]
MVNEILSLIVRTNIALAVCVLLVLALRFPTRRLAGARIAYALWLIPPLAAAACFLPARVEIITLPAMPPLHLGAGPATHAAGPSLDPRYILAAWVGGVAISLIVLILRQTRFARALGRLSRRADLGERVLAAESNEHGPAVIGVLRPVIITPADFDARFSDEERRIVLEHERAHVAQGDPIINALAAALQCVNWFNPFVHLGVRTLRVDQELACDAAVLATAARRSYAEAILKTQIAAGAPLGCAWPSHSLSALKERIAMLKHNLPTRTQRILGVTAVGIASVAACAVAWASQPARVVVAQTHATPNAQPAATPLPPDPLTAPAAYVAPASSAAATAYAEAALAGADPDDVNDAEDASDAADDADAQDMPDAHDFSVDLAQLDDPNRIVTITRNGRTEHRRLTPQERAEIRVQIRQAMDQQRAAMAQARVAIRQAHVAELAGREAARRAELAGEQAQRQAELASRDAERVAARHARMAELASHSPELTAEVNALTAEAMRLESESVHMSQAQREELREEMRRHQERIHEIAEEARDRADDANDDHDDD